MGGESGECWLLWAALVVRENLKEAGNQADEGVEDSEMQKE